MKTAKEIIDSTSFKENEAARVAYAVDLHLQALDDCLTLIADLRSGYFDWDEIPAEYSKQLVDDYRTISAKFRLIQSTLRGFVDDLDAARGIPSPYRREYVETLIEQND